MHDTVARTRKRIVSEPADDVAALFSSGLQEAGVSRALAEPLSGHLDLLYVGARQWLGLSRTLPEGEAGPHTLGELHYASGHIRTVITDLVPFLERVEDNLSERDDVTHRESSYEREVAPFSRLDSTSPLRESLEARDFSREAASEGAQVEADLLKILYLEGVFRKAAPSPPDLYAQVSELLLDCRRHLAPALEPGSAFMTQLSREARAT